jgi:beta-N-acetylhexosaminidase
LRILTIVYTDDPDPFAGRAFRRELEARFPLAESVLLDEAPAPDQLDALRAQADSADLVIFAPFVRVVAGKGEVGMAEPVTELVRGLAADHRIVVVSFGNPYILSAFPDIGTYMLAWGPEAVLQRAAVRALTGEIPIHGRLPVSIPPDLIKGDGLDRIVADGAPGEPTPDDGSASPRP